MLGLNTKKIWLKKWAFEWKIKITISVLESLIYNIFEMHHKER